jgi:Sulfatase/HEAT repeats
MTRWLARSMAAAWLVLAAELAVVALFNHGALTGVWELQYGTLWLAPVAMSLGGLVAVAGGLLVLAARRGDRTGWRRALAALVGLFALGVGWGVGGGRHLATLRTRGGFAGALALASGALAYALAPLLARAIRRWPVRVAGGAAALVVALELVNRFVLVRLYPALHIGLDVAALLVAPTLALALPEPRAREASRWRRTAPAAVTAAALVVAMAAARPASARLAHFDNFRLMLVDRAPLLAEGVRLAARLAPPVPIPSTACGDDPSCLPLATEEGVHGRSLDLRGRDVLLISVDALRADHVGAYGYARHTTPNIDALARSGIVFTHAYCPIPRTSYSITSMMTGKYIRPLLLQGAGENSDTWASLLRTYGYRTAGFYPPAVFFIDPARFQRFKQTHLGFEYQKVQFIEGDGRVAQVKKYLTGESKQQHLFVWVHLFSPHEPYVSHPGFEYGERDIDRYDSEVAFSDATVGKLVRLFREQRPNAAVIITADHGEEFGDHGGHYHGTTVYEEQVHVPLILNVPGALKPRRIDQVVQTIDLLPTVLGALSIPIPPTVRGRDLGPLIAGSEKPGPGLAFAETDRVSLLAEGQFRLICQRQIGACRLFDLSNDPTEMHDAARDHEQRFERMRGQLNELSASTGLYEQRGLRAEGKDWPAAILRGVAGDGDAAPDIARLLDDADLAIRRKAAELLFQLKRPGTAPALRLALGRDEDPEVRDWCALALTRMGEGAPLVYDLARSNDVKWRRLAALSLAEAGDRRGEGTLLAWWKDKSARDYEQSLALIDAFGDIHSKDAVWPLTQSLSDVRLTTSIAGALAKIGQSIARGPLAEQLGRERYQGARVAIARSLVQLGAGPELAAPLVRWLGVPDPLAGGVGLAMRAKILEQVGGPSPKALAKLQEQAELGVALTLVIPRGGNGQGIRAIVRAHGAGGAVHIGKPVVRFEYDSKGKGLSYEKIPIISASSLSLTVPAETKPVEVYGTLPAALHAEAGHGIQVVVVADHGVVVDGLALVPLGDELPPPAPKPWSPDDGGAGATPSASP